MSAQTSSAQMSFEARRAFFLTLEHDQGQAEQIASADIPRRSIEPVEANAVAPATGNAVNIKQELVEDYGVVPAMDNAINIKQEPIEGDIVAPAMGNEINIKLEGTPLVAEYPANPVDGLPGVGLPTNIVDGFPGRDVVDYSRSPSPIQYNPNGSPIRAAPESPILGPINDNDEGSVEFFDDSRSPSPASVIDGDAAGRASPSPSPVPELPTREELQEYIRQLEININYQVTWINELIDYNNGLFHGFDITNRNQDRITAELQRAHDYIRHLYAYIGRIQQAYGNRFEELHMQLHDERQGYQDLREAHDNLSRQAADIRTQLLNLATEVTGTDYTALRLSNPARAQQKALDDIKNALIEQKRQIETIPTLESELASKRMQVRLLEASSDQKMKRVRELTAKVQTAESTHASMTRRNKRKRDECEDLREQLNEEKRKRIKAESDMEKWKQVATLNSQIGETRAELEALARGN